MRAGSEVLEIGGKRILCVKRYDRTIDPDGNIIRWHQEDTCQATGRYPNQKYQSDGGASAAEITRLLERFSDDRLDDVSRFIMALALNWVIAGTDAHSKNYSLLHGPGNFLRLAPFYDLASWLPYERDIRSTKVKLAMKIGGTYRLHEIDGKRWRRWAEETDQDPLWVMACVETLVGNIIESVDKVRDHIAESHEVAFLNEITKWIAERARKCKAALK